ncbi:MAG: hypothetical protein VKI81_08560 [Synechococcaceae cyanobacterium]|nr:hypothetical protein [Synechococcaceae cyanobacterium]
MLADYVDLRLQIGREPHRVKELIAASERLQDDLWAHALTYAPQARSPRLAALAFSAHNEVFDVHAVRYNAGVVFRLNPAIWGLLSRIAIGALFLVELEFGVTGGHAVSAAGRPRGGSVQQQLP